MGLGLRTKQNRRSTMHADTGWVTKTLLYAMLLLFTIMTLYPMIWLLINSFKTTQAFQLDRLGLPTNWYWANYPGAWRVGEFGTLFGNSIFYTTVATVAIIILSMAAGFAFAKLPSRATRYLHGSFILGILLTIQSILIPLFVVANWTGLDNTRLGVIIVYVGLGLPIGVYLCTEYIRGIPDAVVESARIDGASYIRIFGSIILPMAKPVAATLAILNVQGIWNEFILINILVSDTELRSLPVGILRFSGALSSDYGRQFAALVIGMVPMVIFYLVFRKEIVKGVAAGSVKG